MDKTFDAAAAEPRLYAAWDDAGAFAAGAGARRDETFSVLIPPPNVTGSLHMGHAFNNTLQDILVRWHRMRGHDTLWQPGTDHAGIATQMVVERELARDGKRRTDMTRDAFTARVWDQKKTSRDNIIGQLKRLGASCDWSREAFTMSGAPGAPAGEEGNFHDAVIRVFVRMYEDGLIYRGKRLVNWDPHFETAISDLEVENVEVDGHMWHFRYPLAVNPETGDRETYTYTERDEDGAILFEELRDWISIATTRPETMLGDGAVAVHPSDERYAAIVGKLCEIPVGPKEHRRLIPIITDDYPDPAFGSGAVKITGAHDFNDYGVAKRGDIPMYRLMDTKAAMRGDGAPYAEAAATAQRYAQDWLARNGYADRQLIDTGLPDEIAVDALNLVPDDLRGLDRFEARARVVAEITAEGLAVMVPETDPRLGRKSATSAPPASGQDGLPTDSYEEGGTAPELALVPLVEPKKIMQPMGDRSRVVIEPMLTDQWFVDAEKIVSPALEAVENGTVQILPEESRKVYFHWLRNIEPWCISRQLWWGHRIPVWYGPKFDSDAGIISTPSIHNENEVLQEWRAFCAFNEDDALESAQRYYEGRGFGRNVVSVETKLDALRLFAKQKASFSPPQIPIFRDPDVLDTWFSSGLWPLGTLGWPEQTPELDRYFPTSVLVTGFDIIFFWVARMMMMQTAVLPKDTPLADRVPFRTVYVHALVRDETGKKMSKSLGNVLDPLELIDEYGADAVRFTLASMAAMGRDLRLSTQRIAGYRNFGTKLWNAFRFAEMNGGFAARSAAPPAPLGAVNRWIVGETARVREEVDAALSEFRFNDAAGALYAFVWGRVCDWYIEFAKPLLADEAAAPETRATMAWVLDRCLVMLHPFMPFITEELWAQSGHDDLLILAAWPEERAADAADPAADRELSWVIALIEAVRSVRGEMNVPAGLMVPLLELDLDAAGRAAWERHAALISRLARIGSVTPAAAAPRGSATITVPGGTYALPLADIIDVAAERARLERALQKLGKDLGGLLGRLANPRFVESASAEVVEETRGLAAEKEAEAARLEAALARLSEMA